MSESDDNQLPVLEQTEEATRQIAKMIALMFNTLRGEGLDAKRAMQLTICWIQATFGQGDARG